MEEFITYVLPMYDVISFDIFDTFLLRPVLAPADLFTVIGGVEFRNAREQAEYKTWCQLKKPYTIDDIYARMPDKFKHMQEAEISGEKRHTVVNPEMMEAYVRARELGKKVVFVSDMYLPEHVMRDILASKGITEFDGIYTSCTRGGGKATGYLFKVMLDDQGVGVNDVVHIGDSREHDLKSAEKLRLHTVYYPKIKDVFFDRERRVFGSFNQLGGMKNAHIRLFYGALALAWHLNKCAYGDDPWRRTGCTITAPIYYSYTKWLLEQAHRLGKKKLVLTLRDCHIVGEILRNISPDTRYSYIAASRSVLYPLLDHGLKSDSGKAIARYVKSVITDLDNSLLVEGTSGHITCERAIQLIFERGLPTAYLNLCGEHGASHDLTFIKNKQYLSRYILLENAGLAPFNSFSGISSTGKPELKEESRYEAYRNHAVTRRTLAAIDTAVLLDANGEYLTGGECEKFVDYCIDNIDLHDAAHLMSQFGSAKASHVEWQRAYWK